MNVVEFELRSPTSMAIVGGITGFGRPVTPSPAYYPEPY
jgi:hypothetical protein